MKKKIIFDKLMVEFVEQKNVYTLEMNSNNCDWLDEMEPEQRFIQLIYLKIYGVPVILDEDLENAYYDEDVSKFSKIGSLMGYYVPFAEILEQDEEPIAVCDDVLSDLSFTASVIQDYYEGNERYIHFAPSIFYIDELEIDEQYRNNGFGSKVLQELPYLLSYHKRIIIDIISYFPAPTQREKDEPTPYEEAMMRQAVYKINEYFSGESFASQLSKDKIVAIPRHYSKKEIDELIEIEKNTPNYLEEYKNMDLFRFYEKNGFKEFNQTRLLVKDL